MQESKNQSYKEKGPYIAQIWTPRDTLAACYCSNLDAHHQTSPPLQNKRDIPEGDALIAEGDAKIKAEDLEVLLQYTVEFSLVQF